MKTLQSQNYEINSENENILVKIMKWKFEKVRIMR